MPGRRLKPKLPLGALVGCLWYWEGAPGPHLRERLLPNAEASMVFNLRDDPNVEYEDDGHACHYGQAVISGARSNCFAIDCNVQDRVIGVQFRPGGAAPFFPMPVSAGFEDPFGYKWWIGTQIAEMSVSEMDRATQSAAATV